MGAPTTQERQFLREHSHSGDKDGLTAVESTYTSLIQQYLAVYCIDNAAFYAERLVATRKTPHSVYLQGLCYYRQGKPQRTKAVLQNANNPSPAIQYLLAKACLDLKDYGEAEEALLRQARADFLPGKQQDILDFILASSPCPIPNGAAGLHLLGQVCRLSGRKKRSIEYYRLSLQLDPMMWTSLEALCELGVDSDLLSPTDLFGVAPPAVPTTTTAAATSDTSLYSAFSPPGAPKENKSVLQPMDMSTTSAVTPSFANSSMPKASLFPPSAGGGGGGHSRRGGGGAVFQTPNLTPIANTTDVSMLAEHQLPPATNPRILRRARQVATRRYYEPSPELSMTPVAGGAPPRSLFLSGLDEDDAVIIGPTKTPSVAKVPALRSTTNRKQPRALAFGNLSTTSELAVSVEETPKVGRDIGDDIVDADGLDEILQLLSILGTAQVHLGRFRSKEAIQLLERLPSDHFHTGYVLHQVGRAYFEMADYGNSMRYLQMMEQMEPHRMKGLEVLSTALWHMRREVELSHLAQRVTEFDRLAPETWCVVGNCFSLQKDHETALTFFRRSIQLDSTFSYAHTLSGHEHFANEDFEKAVACYRDAIRVDERHYNAWYGLGAIYHCQEKYDLSEYHFMRACKINPQSSVLICHLGMAQNSSGKPYAALDTLQAAFRMDPRNAQAHYQRALVYRTLERPKEALLALAKVRDAAPKEAQIYFAMGRLHKRMGNSEQAMRCFLSALDLDPKDTNLIKAAMEKLDEPDVEEEISTF